MNQFSIIQPAAALFVLTIAVWAYMYGRRLHFMYRHGVNPQAVATPELISERLPAHINNSSNNLKNLFELPVVFYALCAFLLATHRVDAIYLYAAWAYVGLRVLHSLVHCTVNIVKLRFTVYLFSTLMLWFMVVRFAIGLIQALPAG